MSLKKLQSLQALADELRTPRMPEGDVILTCGPLVGLGDHLIYSTLPERFAKLGYKVYLDKDVAARNTEVLELWKMNPYITDLTDRKPNAGYARQGRFYELANQFPPGCIEVMERAHGLPPPYGIAPKIYYEPKDTVIDVSQSVLVDFSASSSKIGQRGINEALRMMVARFEHPPFVQILLPSWVSLHPAMVAGQSYMVDGIFEYLDLLHKCRAWIGSEAGGQALAAAVRGEHDCYDMEARPQIVPTLTVKTSNSRGYTFRGADNRHTNDAAEMESDYHWPLEVSAAAYEVTCKMSAVVMSGWEQRGGRG